MLHADHVLGCRSRIDDEQPESPVFDYRWCGKVIKAGWWCLRRNFRTQIGNKSHRSCCMCSDRFQVRMTIVEGEAPSESRRKNRREEFCLKSMKPSYCFVNRKLRSVFWWTTWMACAVVPPLSIFQPIVCSSSTKMLNAIDSI